MIRKISSVEEYLKTYQELPLLEDPHPLLKEVSTNFIEAYNQLPELKEKMIEKMRSSNGIGLAAPQVALNLRILVLDIISKNKKGEVEKEPVMMVNPVILSKEGSCAIEEGCLSIPDQKVEVVRFKKVVVEYFNEFGDKETKTLEDINAICVQHEIDHLDGILMTDYLLNTGLK